MLGFGLMRLIEYAI
jgi:rare lipoprotein A